MKQLFITIVCACTALAVMAGASRPDFSRAKQVFKKGPVAATTSVGQSMGCHFLLQCMLSRFSCVRLCATLWTAAHQAPLVHGIL